MAYEWLPHSDFERPQIKWIYIINSPYLYYLLARLQFCNIFIFNSIFAGVLKVCFRWSWKRSIYFSYKKKKKKEKKKNSLKWARWLLLLLVSPGKVKFCRSVWIKTDIRDRKAECREQACLVCRGLTLISGAWSLTRFTGVGQLLIPNSLSLAFLLWKTKLK